MTQYIDKNEVENILRNLWKEDDGKNSEHRICYNKALQDVQCEIDTLEVKEVDLDTNFGVCWGEYCDCGGNINDYKVAKHFFELGMAARTDKELVEEVYSHLDGIKDTADRMTSGNFMHNRAAIKFSANTIAKVLELMGLKAQKGE